MEAEPRERPLRSHVRDSTGAETRGEEADGGDGVSGRHFV